MNHAMTWTTPVLERAGSCMWCPGRNVRLTRHETIRENERGSQIGGNWDPTHHQPIDVFTTFTDKDYMLGLTSGARRLDDVRSLRMRSHGSVAAEGPR